MQRSTRQRSAIQDVITKAGRPLSPQDVHKRAQRKVPSIGMATVYRALNGLVEEGQIRAVEIPGKAPRYEPSDLEHHHHFYCTSCDQVFDLKGCPMNTSFSVPRGFKVTSHEVTLFGTCPSCS